MFSQVARYSELQCRVVGGDADTAPSLAVVLCHGFGAPGTDLVPLASEMMARSPALARAARFYFPAAPLELVEFGMFDARAWWRIDVGRYERALAAGQFDTLRREVPEGLAPARRQLLQLVELVGRETGLPTGRIALGGFSQGAMLATDVALRLDEAPAALLAFSGTLLAEDEWRPRAARRVNLPTFVTHGRQDPLLPYLGAEWLRDFLTEAGLDVSFWPFDGGHTIDRLALAHAASLLERLLPADDEEVPPRVL